MEERMGTAFDSDFITVARTLAPPAAAIATLALTVLGLGVLFWPVVTAGRRGGGRTPDGR
jgi:hypothetical protein